MRALIQRVSQASVSVEKKLVAEIKYGLLIFICAMQGDGEKDTQWMASKISKLRIFRDDKGKINRSIVDIRGEALIISQFTLAADITRGNRPGFTLAASPEIGKRLYDCFKEELTSYVICCKTGIFGSEMKVSLLNDGPMTIWIDNKET